MRHVLGWLGAATLGFSFLGHSGTVLAQAERPAVPKHNDRVVQGVQDHLDRLCDGHDARLAKIGGREALVREIDESRARFVSLLGLDFKAPRKPPAITKVGVLEFPEYRVERIVLQSAPGVPVPCSVYVPKKGPDRKPALLCPHGHSGRDRPVYQNAYQRFAKAGFIVLAKDGWGKQERRATGHGEAGGQLALTGTELMALELFDNVRCLDYLETRPDVDPERLVMAGISGGGSQTLYTAAIEPRLKAASPTCAVTTFRADLADTTMCVCEMAHDILTVGDHGLLLAMAYPRPLLVVNGTRDPIFPVAGARAAAAQAKQLYAAGGRGDDVVLAEFDSPHDWTNAMLDRQIAWFRHQLKLPELASLPPADGPIDEERLRCFPDADIPGARWHSLSQVNRDRMRSAGVAAGLDTASRGRSLEADRENLAQQIRQRWSAEPTTPSHVEHRELGPDPRRGGRRERLSWTSGLGGTVTAVVTRGADLQAGAPVVIHLEDRDRPQPQLERFYWDDLIKGRAVVVSLGYTGAGLAPNVEAQVGSALIASGRSLLAERVRDLVVALRVLREERVLNGSGRLSLVAHGFDGVLLLAASPFLPSDTTLVLDRTPISYLAGPEVDFSSTKVLAPPYHWTILPGLASRHDLVELLELAHPRRVVLTHPRDAAQEALGRERLDSLLGRLARTDRTQIESLTSERTRAEVLRKIVEAVAPPQREPAAPR